MVSAVRSRILRGVLAVFSPLVVDVAPVDARDALKTLLPAGRGNPGPVFNTAIEDVKTSTEPQRSTLTCPLCDDPITHPGYGSDGSPAMAECLICDILFDLSDCG